MQDVQPQARSERQTSFPTLATPEPGPCFEPEPSLELVEAQSNKLTWCVDLGAELRAMSTLDLWIALSRGDVPRSARVWRLGREAWTPASEVAELACALKPVGDDYPIIALHSLDAEESERIATLGYGEPAPEELVSNPRIGSPSHVDPSELSSIERAARETAERPRMATLGPMPVAAQPIEETPRGRSTFAPVASISPPAPLVSTPPSAMSIAPGSSGATVHRLPLTRRARRSAGAMLAAAAAWLLLASPLSSTTSTATPLRALAAAPSVLAEATRVAEPIAEEQRATELAVARIRMHLGAEQQRAAEALVAKRDEAAAPNARPVAAKPVTATLRAAKPRAASAVRGPRQGKSFSPTHRGQKRSR